MSSYTSSPRHGNDGDVDENESLDMEDDKDYDTEDASETEAVKPTQDFTPIKEQMYQDKLAQLKKQLQQLKEGLLPEYMKKLKKIEIQYRERLRLNEVWLNYELELVEKDYVKEKKAANKEFEEKKIDLKENLIAELEEKKRMIECERSTVELTGADSMEMKPIATRKLRRRPNDPIPLPEKRRKPSPAQLNYILDEDDIMEDLKILNKVSGKPFNKRPQPVPTPMHANTQDNLFEARIDDGKLYYEKRWFHRGQSVYVDSKDTGRFPAVISAVGTQEIWLRKTADNSKLRIYCTQLQKGRYSIRKRTS